jgi:YD repeat-containing protein
MSVTIGGVTFDRMRYDRAGDVLYLHVSGPATAVDFDASPEGHALRYDAGGRLVGVTLVNARWLLEHKGRITVTLPAPPATALGLAG